MLHQYGAYGLSISSDIALGLPRHEGASLASIELRLAPESVFGSAAAVSPRPRFEGEDECFTLPDGSDYLRWASVGEFLIAADGRRLWCRPFHTAPVESFHVYMLGLALSLALVKLGFEPLHATAIVVEDQAVVFLGHSGVGKSSLAASFVVAGYRLLTDDVLVLRASNRTLLAYPGPARVKLFPKIARDLLDVSNGTPMHAGAAKLVLPLPPLENARPVEVGAIYTLAPPRQLPRNTAIRIDGLSARETFVMLAAHTSDDRHVDAGRLRRQFAAAAEISETTTVRRLSYPRIVSLLPQVRDAVLDDLRCVAPGAVMCGS